MMADHLYQCGTSVLSSAGGCSWSVCVCVRNVGVLLSLILSVTPMKELMLNCADNTWLACGAAKTKPPQRTEMSISYSHGSRRITWGVWTGLSHSDHWAGFRKQQWVESHGACEPGSIHDRKLSAKIYWRQRLFSVSQHFKRKRAIYRLWIRGTGQKGREGILGLRSENHAWDSQGKFRDKMWARCIGKEESECFSDPKQVTILVLSTHWVSVKLNIF